MTEKSLPDRRLAPELLAPAGNWECIRAAIENGADAVYFGLQSGFNARARAANFAAEELPRLMETLHARGVLGYVTLNTLIFTDELVAFEETIRAIAAAGVDAVLVQDIGAVRLIRETCPELSIHASTQMTMVSAETIAAIESLGIERVVLARELSIAEITKITSATAMPVECFVHGALCVAYSGQCLTSESLGGRSANRGQCAQACRLNYTLYSDNVKQELGANQYLLSPQDLAGINHIPQLIEAGVCSMKIEGRLKTPEYVANIVRSYRHAIDDAMAGQHQEITAEEQRQMEMSFSRGFTPGWLEGCNHKRLVPGLSSAKRGVMVGTVVALRGERLTVDLMHPMMKGDGVVLEGDRAAGKEVGGRIYEVFAHNRPVDEAIAGRVDWFFQRGLLRDADCYPGQQIWQTDDPRLSKQLRATYSNETPNHRRNIDIQAFATVGKPLKIQVQCDKIAFTLETDAPLAEANKHAVTPESLHQQLGRLGESAYTLRNLDATIEGKPMVPFSVLGKLRLDMVNRLQSESLKPIVRSLAEPGVAARMIAQSTMEIQIIAQNTSMQDASGSLGSQKRSANLVVLVRSLAQLEHVIAAGVGRVYADFHDIRQYRDAVTLAKSKRVDIYLATLRIQKPGEIGLFKALAKHEANGWLVRNLAALRFARALKIPCVADFSLNVTNPLTAAWLIDQGAQRITASYDLNRDQLIELVDSMPSGEMEIVIHQHMPMFHMEHCVFCTVLSPGTNKSNCGRPCDRHSVEMEDRIGVKHVLHADIGCRNTLYNGVAQSGAEAVEDLMARGIQHFRIELLNDAPADEIKRMVSLYQRLLAGETSGAEVWRALRAENRLGVTRGTLEHSRNPLAIA
ncbi:MAG: DUF3656 domain-containing protein [Planctomycetota bacterium]|nr:DUF3656 domain-containing protein [Planctomycetota bacterium]